MYLWCVDLQRYRYTDRSSKSCDLLTECIFDVLTYNCWNSNYWNIPVVICLQNVSLMCWLTTFWWRLRQCNKLWFAYRMYLWCVDLQHSSFYHTTAWSCDLLTECIFDVLTYNKVVNWCKSKKLWFAYRMYLWCVDLQPMKTTKQTGFSCDLLTECIFDVLTYNQW